MRKPLSDAVNSAPVIELCRSPHTNPDAPSAGDVLIEAIANAVALKLERMAGIQQRLMEVKDASKYLGMTEDALRHKAGVDIPCVRIDGKLRFDRRELDRYIDRAPRQGI
jgi:hypothetical protein